MGSLGQIVCAVQQEVWTMALEVRKKSLLQNAESAALQRRRNHVLLP